MDKESTVLMHMVFCSTGKKNETMEEEEEEEEERKQIAPVFGPFYP